MAAEVRSEQVEHKFLDEHEYDGMRMPGAMSKENLDRMKTFRLKDDVMIVSYPKTGTSWVQEMAWIIYHDGDIEAAKKEDVQQRVPFLEHDDVVTGQSYLDKAENGPRPAVLKTHLPAHFFETQLKEDKAKYIIQIRNPKDCLVSLYHFFQAALILGKFSGTWDEFFEMAMTRGLHYGSQFDMYLSWWQYKDRPDMLWVKYEDMHKDLPKELRRIADFLGKDISDEKILEIAMHGSFNSMKNNNMANYSVSTGLIDPNKSPFMRSGKTAEWKKYFNEDQNRRIEELYESKYKANGLILDFE